MNKNKIIEYSVNLDDDMEYKINFMSWCYSINKNKILSDLLHAFENVKNLSNLNKRNNNINFFYVNDNINHKKYKVISVKNGDIDECK